MGEQSYARIQISGSLPARHWKDLASCLGDDFYEPADDWRDEFERRINDALKGKFDTFFFAGLASWGNPDMTMDFCQEHGLSYQRSWESSGAYDHGCAYWKPGLEDEKESEADESGAVVVLVSDLQRALNEGKTLADVIESRKAFSEEMGPLVLLFADAASPELLQPASNRDDEVLRCHKAFTPYETRVRSLAGEFEGTGLLIAWGVDRDDKIMTEVRVGDDGEGKWVCMETESKNLEIVNG